MTKKQSAIIAKHDASNLYYLSQCYGSYSWAKECAYDDCRARCARMNGYNFKIISYNAQMFSIGFYYVKDGKTMFHYETNVTVLDFMVA